MSTDSTNAYAVRPTYRQALQEVELEKQMRNMLNKMKNLKNPALGKPGELTACGREWFSLLTAAARQQCTECPLGFTTCVCLAIVKQDSIPSGSIH